MDLCLDQMAITKPHKADMILGLEDGIKKLKKKKRVNYHRALYII